MSGSREDDILSRIPGIEDTNDSATDTSEDTSQGTGGDAGIDDTDKSAIDGVFSGRGTKDAPDKAAAQQPPIVRRHDGLVERQSTTNPRTRDLVDPVTGAVVANGGIERRVYETAQRTQRENQQLQQQLREATTRVEALSSANTLGQQLGLSSEHQTAALRVMSDFIRDPVKTVEYMIAEVKAKGYSIPSLEGQGGQSDMAAFQRMLDERLAPLTQQRQQEVQLQQAEANARRELDNFLNQEPDARNNLDVISQMLTQDRQLSLPNAYIRLLRWSAQNGFDPSQPLGPQIEARQTQQPPLPVSQTRTPRPMPNGRTMSNGVVPTEQRRSFDENTDWRDIIDASMREAGINR